MNVKTVQLKAESHHFNLIVILFQNQCAGAQSQTIENVSLYSYCMTLPYIFCLCIFYCLIQARKNTILMFLLYIKGFNYLILKSGSVNMGYMDFQITISLDCFNLPVILRAQTAVTLFCGSGYVSSCIFKCI